MSELTFELVIGTIFLVLGIGIIYWISRRKFYRRNMAGLEGFSSFEASVFIRFLERIGKWLAYGLIIIGLLLLWTHSRTKKEQEKQLQKAKTEQSAQRDYSSSK